MAKIGDYGTGPYGAGWYQDLGFGKGYAYYPNPITQENTPDWGTTPDKPFGNYRSEEDAQFWADPIRASQYGGVNPATGLPYTPGDAEFGGYVNTYGNARTASQNKDKDANNANLNMLRMAALAGAGAWAGGAFGGGGLFGGEAAALGAGEAAGAAGAFDAAAGLGGATSAGAGGALTGGTMSFEGLGALGAAGAAGGSMSTLSDLYNYIPQGLSGPTASGIPLDVASGMFGPTESGWSLAEALGSESTAGALSGAASSSSVLDLIKQYGQPAAKALGLTNADGSINWGAIGSAGAGLAGYLGSKSQADDYMKLADRYDSYGAPSRGRYESAFSPGFTMANDPGYTDALNQSSKATLHGLSAQGQGNPAENPNAWAQSLKDNYQQTAYPALQNYRTLNANAGGIASAAPAAIGFQKDAIQSNLAGTQAIGSAANNIFNPPQTTAQQFAQLRDLFK